MKVHILDDWFDSLRTLPWFELLGGHDVTVWTDHETEVAALAARVLPGEALVLIHERSRITANLLGRLPTLRLISLRGGHSHLDVDACVRNGVLPCSNLHTGTPSCAAAELTLALILASLRRIPEHVNSIRAGNCQEGIGRTLRGRRSGL